MVTVVSVAAAALQTQELMRRSRKSFEHWPQNAQLMQKLHVPNAPLRGYKIMCVDI